MAKRFITDVTQTTINLNKITPSNVSSTYAPYNLYVEYRDDYDEPEEYQYNLYSLFKSGMDNLAVDDNHITIGEDITSQNQMVCTGNYELITKTFKNVGSTIDYDAMNSKLPLLKPDKSYSELSSVLWEWVNEEVYDFNVRQNPEDADDSNLILPRQITSIIQDVTESILNKILRNFMQLIRVRHDYRLYGTGATIFGGYSDKFKSAAEIGKWSSLPPSCWQQFTGNYIVGEEAYGEKLENIADTIKSATYTINPYLTYGIAAHVHEINMSSFSMGNVKLRFNNILTGDAKNYFYTEQGDHPGTRKDDDTQPFFTLSQLIGKHISGANGSKSGLNAYSDIKSETVECEATIKYKYSWNSDNAKLVSPDDSTSNIFKKDNITLPTYSSYVWKWVGSDNTSVSSI